MFTNKSVDLINLKRLLPENRLTCVAAGIIPGDFRFDRCARAQLRRQWQRGEAPVIFSAAVFRPDVKTEGLTWVIRAFGELYRQGHSDSPLTVAGEKQALRWGKILSQFTWDLILVSDTGRALATAEIVNAKLKLPRRLPPAIIWPTTTWVLP